MNPYILIGQPTNCILVQVIGYISLVNLLCHEKICTGVLCPKGCLHHNILVRSEHRLRSILRLICDLFATYLRRICGPFAAHYLRT